MGELLAERLKWFEPRDHDVTITHRGYELGEPALARLVIRTPIVDTQLFGCVGVVEHDHLAIADHGHTPGLDRVEPAHVHAGEDLVGVAERDKDHVLGSRFEVGLPSCHQVDWISAKPVAEHRQVVRCQVPERVHVLADGAEPGALEVQITDFAQQALVDVGLDGSYGWVEQERVSDHECA